MSDLVCRIGMYLVVSGGAVAVVGVFIVFVGIIWGRV